MPVTAAKTGYGSLFGIEGGTPGTYVDVGEVTSITPPSRTRETVDATQLNSPDGTEEVIAGLLRTGEARIAMNLVPSATHVLADDFDNTTGNYQITFPNGVRMQFTGIPIGLEYGDLTPEGRMTVSFSIKAQGAPALLAAA